MTVVTVNVYRDQTQRDGSRSVHAEFIHDDGLWERRVVHRFPVGDDASAWATALTKSVEDARAAREERERKAQDFASAEAKVTSTLLSLSDQKLQNDFGLSDDELAAYREVQS